MYYIFGDIHACLNKLVALYDQVNKLISDDDTLIFLGDYIDRGKYSCEVIEYLLRIREKRSGSVFIMGNHERMLFDYLDGKDPGGNYLYNGGTATRQSYVDRFGSFHIPERHREFFNSLVMYYEGDDFIAVHAGLDPRVGSLAVQSAEDLVWIREKFYRSNSRFPKTVIFGHTPTYHLHGRWGVPYIDEQRNIIGIDTGAVYGAKLTCLVWPQKNFIQA